MLLRRLLAVLALLAALALPALAREEIRSFASDVALQLDGSVDVTETIEVNAEGIEIRRGIYRDIPVMMLGPQGGKVRPDLAVISVERDGRPETFRVERMGEFQRIWIGSPDRLLDYRVHTYVIRYTLSRMARSFADHDELYWNATGNYWIFPILSARSTVRLPDGAMISNLAGYTGIAGSTEQAVAIKQASDTTATFRATRPLGAGEGMTVAVAFSKGVVTFPSGTEALALWLADMREVLFPLLAVLVAFAYNALAWLRVGRDPEKGTIIPLFHPPKGFSPALVHYAHNWGFGNAGWTAFTATIFDLGVKGLVTIDNTSKQLTIKTTGKSPDEPLPTAEKLVFDYLADRGTTVVGKATGPELQKRRGEFMAAIERENRQTWFRNNTGYSVLGLVLAIGLLAAMAFAGMLEPIWLIGTIAGGIFIAIFLGAVSSMAKNFHFLRIFGLLWLGVFGFNMGGALLESFSSITVNTAAIAAVSIVSVTVLFAVLMRAPTVQGRKIMDEIDGFKLYIETAEKERLNLEAEPPMTVSRFERILPYAIALGVEKPWSEHFDAELARNAVSDATAGYHPSWYRGSTGSISRSASGMTSAVSTAAASMTAAMVAAQPVQSSSSGFSGGGGGGGGGSSGGGGGGGGGGGW